MKNFKNKPNEHIVLGIDTNEGSFRRDIWISRSVVVAGIVVFLLNKGNKRILVVKRSKKMDEPDKFSLPCGYLDWNETTYDAMVREVYEETSLFIPDYKEFMLHSDFLMFRDDPNKDRKQNVSFYFLTVFDFSQNLDKLPKIFDYTSDETAAVGWVSRDDLDNGELEWAFGHNNLLIELYDNKKI